MANKSAILSVRVVTDTKDAQKGFDDASNKVSGFESGLKKAAVPAAATLGVIGALGKKAFDAASELQQTSGAVNSVFKGYSSEITSWSKTAWKSVGLSQSQAQQQATLLGSQLKNMGMPMDQVAGKTKTLVSMGADLASMYGGTTSDAVDALSSALKGERDPIEKYGISIKQSSLDSWEAAHGMTGLTGAAKTNADMQATLALVTKQSADSQGNFAKEANTAEGAAQRNAARWKNVAANMGKILLPIVTKVSGALASLAGWMGKNQALAQTIIGIIGGVAAAILAANAALGVYRAVTTLAAAAQLGLNLAWLTNPMTWIILGIIALVVLLVTHFGTLKQVALNVWNAISTAASWLWNSVLVPFGQWIASVWTATWTALKAVGAAVWDAYTAPARWLWNSVLVPFGQWIASVWTATWTALKAVGAAVWDAYTAPARWLWNSVLVPFGQWIAGTFVAAWTTMKDAGTNAWNALVAPIQTVIGWVKKAADWVGSLFGATGALGMTANASYTVTGAAHDGIPATAASGGIFGALASIRTSTASPQPSTTVNITVDGALDALGVARQIIALLKQYTALTGMNVQVN